MHGWNDEMTAHVLKTVNLRYLSMVIVVVQWLSHVQLCNPIDYSTPGFPVLHYLPEFVLTQFYFTLLFLFHFGGLRRTLF